MEDITTIFVVGFPDDMREREFQNLFMFAEDFEEAVLKIPSANPGYINSDHLFSFSPIDTCIEYGAKGLTDLHTTSGYRKSTGLNGPFPNTRKQIIGFARFKSVSSAMKAIAMLSGKRVDPERCSLVLKAELAKKNLFPRKGNCPDDCRLIPDSSSQFSVCSTEWLESIEPPLQSTLTQMNESSVIWPMKTDGFEKKHRSRSLVDFYQYLADSKSTDVCADQESADDCQDSCADTECISPRFHFPLSFELSEKSKQIFDPGLAIKPPQCIQTSESLSPDPSCQDHMYSHSMGDLKTNPFSNVDTMPMSTEYLGLGTSHQISLSQHYAFMTENPPCNTLYVGNLPLVATERELLTLFCQCSGFKRLSFKTKSNGPMCFVEFDSIEYATMAMRLLNGSLLDSSTKGGIRLSYSKNPLGVRPPGYLPKPNSTTRASLPFISCDQSAFRTSNIYYPCDSMYSDEPCYPLTSLSGGYRLPITPPSQSPSPSFNIKYQHLLNPSG